MMRLREEKHAADVCWRLKKTELAEETATLTHHLGSAWTPLQPSRIHCRCVTKQATPLATYALGLWASGTITGHLRNLDHCAPVQLGHFSGTIYLRIVRNVGFHVEILFVLFLSTVSLLFGR